MNCRFLRVPPHERDDFGLCSSGAEIALAAVAVGTAVTAYGQYQTGQNAKKAASFNAAMMERNAQAARDQARQDSILADREGRRRLGSINAARGASGVGIEGSALDVLEESAANVELDRQTILYRGELRAIGYEDSGALERMKGRHAAEAGYFSAASTLLLGGGKATGMYDALPGSTVKT